MPQPKVNPTAVQPADSESELNFAGPQKIDIPSLNPLIRSCESFVSCQRNADWGSLQFKGDSLVEALEKLITGLDSYLKLVGSFNSLPDPGRRDEAVGKSLLPLVAAILQGQAPGRKEQLLKSLYNRTNPGRDGKGVSIRFPEWMAGVVRHLSLKVDADSLPGIDTYLEVSAQSRTPHLELCRKEEALKGELNAYLEKAAKSPYLTPQIIEAKKGEWLAALEAVYQEKLGLFNKTEDIFPEKIPGVLSSLKVNAAPKDEFLARLLECGRGLEGLIAGALSKTAGQQKIEVKVPVFDNGGGIQRDSFVFTAPHIKDFQNSPQAVVVAIESLLSIRRAVRAVSAKYRDMISGKQYQDIMRFLEIPMMVHGAGGLKAYEALADYPQNQVKAAYASLLSEPANIDENTEKQILGTISTLKPLSWTVVNCFSAAPAEREPYLKLLRGSPELSSAVLPLVENVLELLDRNDHQKIAQTINTVIEDLNTSAPYAAYAPAVVLAALLQSKRHREKLRNQIPSIDTLKEKLEKVPSPMKGQALDLARFCESNLSFSMVDFYSDPGMADLWKFVEKFKVFLRHPDCLDGLAGNEGMRSGILVDGEPGVGKTFFVECLANELGLKLLKISPDEGEVSSSKRMIDACRATISEAKLSVRDGRACILFIDEAEVVMADRDNPRTSQEQSELTCYLLQEINEIRVKFPRILIVAATNFIKRIDGGMQRVGRFDIHVSMGRPGPEMRKGVILGSLEREKINLKLSDEQLEQLVEESAGLIALPIKRVIFEYNRIGRLMAAAEGIDFEVTFEGLLQEFREEKQRLLKVRERNSAVTTGEEELQSATIQ